MKSVTMVCAAVSLLQLPYQMKYTLIPFASSMIGPPWYWMPLSFGVALAACPIVGMTLTTLNPGLPGAGPVARTEGAAAAVAPRPDTRRNSCSARFAARGLGSEATPGEAAVGVVVAESGVCATDKAEKITALEAIPMRNRF